MRHPHDILNEYKAAHPEILILWDLITRGAQISYVVGLIQGSLIGGTLAYALIFSPVTPALVRWIKGFGMEF